MPLVTNNTPPRVPPPTLALEVDAADSVAEDEEEEEDEEEDDADADDADSSTEAEAEANSESHSDIKFAIKCAIVPRLMRPLWVNSRTLGRS